MIDFEFKVGGIVKELLTKLKDNCQGTTFANRKVCRSGKSNKIECSGFEY